LHADQHGNFNAHLADALYLFVDEAFWARATGPPRAC
jgi:hypothetical protein